MGMRLATGMRSAYVYTHMYVAQTVMSARELNSGRGSVSTGCTRFFTYGACV